MVENTVDFFMSSFFMVLGFILIGKLPSFVINDDCL